jgi:hypothetical protein
MASMVSSVVRSNATLKLFMMFWGPSRRHSPTCKLSLENYPHDTVSWECKTQVELPHVRTSSRQGHQCFSEWTSKEQRGCWLSRACKA